MSTSLDKLGNISKVAQKVIDSIFQLERLDELAKKSTQIALAHAEAIMLANYVILAQSEIKLEQLEIFGVTLTAKTFEPTFTGKLDALALVFQHTAGKLDATINANNAKVWFNAIDFVGDIAQAALTGSKVSQSVRTFTPEGKLSTITTTKK